MQPQRLKLDKLMKIIKNQWKSTENSKNQSASSLPNDLNTSPARAQSWAKVEIDELPEEALRRWVMSFAELKEHVLTQWKEAKNHYKILDEWLTRINSVEKTFNDLMELKTMALELCDACTSFNSWFNQVEERLSVTEDQINEIKWEDKIREKKEWKTDKASKKYGTMWKDQI